MENNQRRDIHAPRYELYRSPSGGDTLNSGATASITTTRASLVRTPVPDYAVGPIRYNMIVWKKDANPVTVTHYLSAIGLGDNFGATSTEVITAIGAYTYALKGFGVDGYFEIENLAAVDAVVEVQAEAIYTLGE